MTLLAKNPADRPRNARVVIQAIREVERTPHVIDDALRGSAEHETPHVNTSFVDRIRETEKRVRRLTLQRGRTHGDVVAARAELAELTGRSGDARGAAELYDRLGRDCGAWFGRQDRRSLDAFEGMARWIEGHGTG